MRIGRLWRVTRLNLRRDRRGFLLSAGGVAVGVAAFVFFVALGEGVGVVVRERIFPVDATHVEVVEPKLALGSLLGGGILDDEAAERLYELPEVRHVYRKMELRVPAITRYSGDFFGSPIRMGLEIIGVGVDPGYVAADVIGSPFEDPGEGEGPVPVLLGRGLLEIYNNSFARGRGLPQISDSLLVGFQFPLTLGSSYVGPASGGPPRKHMLEIVGVSDRAILPGVTLPLETVRRWNRERVGEEAATRYRSIVVEAKGVEQVPRVMEAVRAMGLDVDTTQRRLAQEVGAAVTLTTLSMSLLSLLILALAAVNIARASYAAVVSRTREIGLMRAVGATRADVRAMVITDAVAAGFCGGLVGLLLAVGAAAGADALAIEYLPRFPFKPDTFFAFPGWLPVVALAAAIGSAIAGAWLPAAGAARLDPARALST